MITERSPQVKKAVVRLMELSSDERTRMLYESRQKMEWDNQAREREARNEERFIIAKNVLQMKMSIDDIIKLTGLTREEIEALANAD